MKQTVTAIILIVASALTFGGCASIPPEAPALSTELGKRLAAIEHANLTLLHRYFDQKRKEIDRFIEAEWVPVFAKAVFSNPAVAKAWNTVVREDDPKQRLTFLIRVGAKLQKKINDKRAELIQPLDLLERRVEQEIRDAFTQARAMNNSITSYLQSASKVTENRDRYLEMLGVTDEKIQKVIDKTDDAVDSLVKGAEKLPDKVEAAKRYLDKLKKIRSEEE